jgi:hypothetical protein
MAPGAFALTERLTAMAVNSILGTWTSPLSSTPHLSNMALVKETIVARMTDEEAEALDKYYTENTIMPAKGKPGLFAERKAQMFAVDALSAQYFRV